MPENNTHDGNYVGTKNMNADNQNMEFVNDTLQLAADKKAIRNSSSTQTDSEDSSASPSKK
jgi:hypothetical protein